MVPEVEVVIDDSVQAITPEAEQAIVQAFGAWLSASPHLPELNIEHGRGLKPRLDPDGVNAVVYAPIEFPGHEDDLAITIGFSDEETGEITEADIGYLILDTDQSLPGRLFEPELSDAGSPDRILRRHEPGQRV